ncbi:hypothetical protein CLOM_g17379 [Closterium sp. NIES-68]|nr:hypothetical protein CLOM_g17379 [Closterium sp. NIES-68]GJP66645.1 hypothetical protein CLOP_g23558 [Closterium sp. NIES-67]
MATPRVTARPPSPFVAAGKGGGCCKWHVARVYALMVLVSLLALLLFLLVPWAASHGATLATAGGAVAVAEAGSGDRVRGRGRGPQRDGDSMTFGGNGGIAESAMRMGGAQADVIQEKAAAVADAADAAASNEAAVEVDVGLGGEAGEVEEREEEAERAAEGGKAEGRGEEAEGGEAPMPLRVYMLPLTGDLNFHVLLQRWRFASRVPLRARHGMPGDWQFKGNSLRPRGEGDVVGGMVQDDGWVEGEGEGAGEGGVAVQVPAFAEGHGVHIEQYAAEYWLTLSLLAGGLPSLQRVRRAEDAHIIFVPAFSSALYATQMKTNEKRRRAGDTRIPEEQHLLAVITQHALWGDEGEQARGAGEGPQEEQEEGELLEKGEVATGAGSAGGAGEVGGSRRLLRALKGGRRGKGAEEGEGRQGPDGSAERAEGSAAVSSRRRDLLIPAVHPHALSTVRHWLAAAHLLMADFSQPAEQVAHLNKDVIVPYSALIPAFTNDSLLGEAEGGKGGAGGAEAVAAWAAGRPTLVFFRGTLNRQQGGRIRVELARLLSNVSGADIAEGSPLQGGVQAAMAGMRASKFCLVPEGDTASTCRLFDAILSHCIPLVVSDSLDLPFEEALDYTRFALFLPQALALRPGYVEAFLRNVSHESAFTMWQRLREVAQHFVYSSPPKPGGAEDMIWQAVARRWAGDHYGRRYNRENQRRRRRVMEQLLEREGLSAADIVVRPRALPLF